MIQELRRSILAIFLIVSAAVLVAQAGMAVYAWTLFGENLAPEFERKTEAIALALGDRLFKALNLGIPFEALEGTEDYFAEVLQGNRDLAFVALSTAEGNIAHISGLPSKQVAEVLLRTRPRDDTTTSRLARWADLPPDDPSGLGQVISIRIRHGDLSPGTLHIGVWRTFLDAQVESTKKDILVVLLVTLIIVLELLRFVLAPRLLSPLAEIEAQITRLSAGDLSILIADRSAFANIANTLDNQVLSVHLAVAQQLRKAGDRGRSLLAQLNEHLTTPLAPPEKLPARPLPLIRLVTLLFMFGEQLSRPFLPLFAGKLLPEGTPEAATAIWIGVPISAFMLTVACSMPYLTSRSRRWGHRRSFLWGTVCAAVGLTGATICTSIGDFIVWRIVTAFGYALMFIACQNFVIDHTRETARSRGLATFIGAIMVAELCAPGIGGILADRLGERPVFALGAGVMLLAAITGASLLTNKPTPPAPLSTVTGWIGPEIFRNIRLLIFMLTAAIPAKFALTAFMFYIVPVCLHSLDISITEIGRIAMLYAVPSLLAAPVIARIAERMHWHGVMVGLGGIISGAGFLPLLFWPSEEAVVIGVLALGFGQAMSISPQLALLNQICEDEIAQRGANGVIGTYRLIERFGAALGPLVAGTLTALLGPIEAASVLGMLVFICAILFSVSFLALGVRPEQDIFLPVPPPREVSA